MRWDDPALVGELARKQDVSEEEAGTWARLLGPMAQTLADSAVAPKLKKLEEQAATDRATRDQREAGQQTTKEGGEGLMALARAGGQELNLVVDLQKHGRRSALWQELLKDGVDGQGNPLALKSARQVQITGQALARNLEQWDATRDGQGGPVQESTGVGGNASRRAQNLGKTNPEPTVEDEIAASLKAQANRVTSVFPMLSDNFDGWGKT